MKQIYHILPVFTEGIWGGQQLIEKYGFKTDLNNIGECYSVIAMENHLDCDVKETGEKLSVFYQSHKELFKCGTKKMPVRASLSCTRAPMSVQLHPDNEYALAHDGTLGKPDGVYIIDGEGTAEFGHYAKTRAEFRAMVQEERWDSLLRYVNVKKGDFVDMPHGTLHAFGAGLIMIEFSQNADLTYRLYDYERKRIDPKTGRQRVMAIDKVCECVNIPDGERRTTKLTPFEKDGCVITSFHSEPGVYSCGKIVITTTGRYERDQFYFLTCIEGNGAVNGIEIKGGETLFVPCEYGPVEIKGTLELMYTTYIKP